MKSVIQKIVVFGGAATVLAALIGSVAEAHVVVKPSEVPTASYQTFNVSVPNERQDATTKLKLVIPKGVESITPTVKPGWDIAVGKSKDKAESVKSITWKNGSIGEGLRDDFSFSAKTADEPIELQWKAYQTYQDGTTVAWDSADSAGHGGETGPFSVTNVVSEPTDQPVADTKSDSSMALYIAIAGLIVSLISIYFATRRPVQNK
ncbi:MAG: YcnI family protein [bacterium]|nr:YcnI family protein [bacterium]MDN5835137.1 YcnI family protein [bacterium]